MEIKKSVCSQIAEILLPLDFSGELVYFLDKTLKIRQNNAIFISNSTDKEY